MSERFEFERFAVRGCACDECFIGVTAQAEFDGAWVKAQHADEREAVNAAQISRMSGTLAALWREVTGEPIEAAQSRESLEQTLIARVRELLADKARLDSRCIVTKGYDEDGNGEETEWRGIDLRTAIDAGMEKRGLTITPAPVPERGWSRAAPLSEYHEDFGAVVWWTANDDGTWLGEPAWIGRPDDSDWPGYHTHFTLHPVFPEAPARENSNG